jgi:hypothetical protein
MSYGSQKIKYERNSFGGSFVSRVTGIITEADMETIKTNGFINLGPILTIYKDEETRTRIEEKGNGWETLLER